MEMDPRVRNLVLYAVTVAVILVAGFLLKSDSVDSFEADFNVWLNGALSSGVMDSVSGFISRFGGAPLFIAIGAILLISPRTRLLGSLVIVSVAVAWLIDEAILKLAVARPRPYTFLGIEPLYPASTDMSFPSGHAAATAAGAVMFWKFEKRASVLLMAYSAFVCVTRVYLYAHYFSDVVFGVVLGTATAMLFIPAVTFLVRKAWGPRIPGDTD